VGAVGAKLLYGNDTVQHAGVVLGVGNFQDGPGVASHFGAHALRTDPGPFGQFVLAHEVSAVTAACLALRREVFDEVGGFDATNLPIAFNDVDLCLRIRERGYRIVWTPFAELYHHESASRGSDMAADRIARFTSEAAYMRRRWGETLDHDPFYNENFSRADHRGTLALPPRRRKPWAAFLAE
jgi:GT2 family glycosyltransferase